MHDEIEILDIEEKPETFKVVFEVPGDKYDQNYPKRLSHTFPLKDSYFREVGNGKKRYEKILEKNYVKKSEEDKKREEKARKMISEEKDKARGKKLGGET